MRMKKLFFVLIAFILSVTCIAPFATAFAGTSSTEIGSLVSQWKNEGVGDGNWVIDAENDNAVTVTFNGSSTDNATAVTQADLPVEPSDGAVKYASFESEIQINSIPTDSYFAIVFGLDKQKSKVGEKNSLEVYFKEGSTSGMINVGIRYVNSDGTGYDALVDRVDAAKLGTVFTVAGVINLDKSINVTVDYTTMSGENPVPHHAEMSYTLSAFPAGRVGFGQKGGKTETVITGMSVIQYEYVKPRNVEYLETFEPEDHQNGAVGYNANVWYTESDSGAVGDSYLEVRESDGNSYLRFNNTGFAYFITKYTYSNWELSFDMFDVSNKRQYDENGQLVSTTLPQCVLAYGINRSELTSIRDHNTGAQVSCYMGWKPSGGSDDWETESDRRLMVLTNKVYRYRDNTNPWAGTFDHENGNVSNMPTNPFKYQGTMKYRATMIDGILRVWLTPAAEYDLFINGTEAEYIAAEYSKDLDIDLDGDIDATDYAARDLNGDGSVTKADYYYVDEASVSDASKLAKHGAEPAITADIGVTPTGNVMFSVHGANTASTPEKTQTGSLSVDNIYINNLDRNPGGNLFSTVADGWNKVGYKENGWPQREETHYDFYEFYSDEDLLANKLTAGTVGKGINLTELIIIGACALVIVGVAVTAIIIILKAKKPNAPAEEDAEAVVTADQVVEEESAETVESEKSDEE